MHRCSRCHELKGPTGFFRDNRNRRGLTSECRACRAADKRNRRRGIYKPKPLPQAKRPCQRCLDRQHGTACLGPGAGCGCRCRAMLGLEGPFEDGDPTAPTWDVGDPDEVAS